VWGLRPGGCGAFAPVGVGSPPPECVGLSPPVLRGRSCVWGGAGRRDGRQGERRAWRRVRGVTRARGGFLTVAGESHMLLCEVRMDAVRAALRGDGGQREEGG
jgi:hypothetical protein